MLKHIRLTKPRRFPNKALGLLSVMLVVFRDSNAIDKVREILRASVRDSVDDSQGSGKLHPPRPNWELEQNTRLSASPYQGENDRRRAGNVDAHDRPNDLQGLSVVGKQGDDDSYHIGRGGLISDTEQDEIF